VNEENPTRNAWLLSLVGALLFFLFLTSSIVSLGCVCLEDAWEQYWPWFFYLADNVSHGRYPLWDPHSSCGFPFYANPQAGTFYPVYLLFGWLFGGGYRVFVALWLGHWFFGLAGCFVLAKRLGLSPLGAFAASVTFGFSGFFLGHAEHTSFINAAVYVPWIVVLLDVACANGLVYAFPAGAVLGLAGLSGYPGVFWYSLLMIGLWGVFRYGLCRRTVAVVCVVGVVAGVVVSPAYVSFMVEGSGYTDRVGALDLNTACDSGRFPLAAMVSLLVPQFVVSFRALIDSDISMTDGYFGLLGVVALVVAVVHEPLRKRWQWLLIWISVAWLFSLGTTGGLRVVAYYVLPVFRYTRHSALFREFWLMGGAILVGVFVDGLLRASGEDRARVVSLGTWAMALVLVACVGMLAWTAIVPQADVSTMSVLRAISAQMVLASACLTALLLYGRSLVTRTVFACLIVLIVLVDCSLHFSGNRSLVCAEGDGAAVATGFEAASAAKTRVLLTGTEKRRDAPRFHPNQGLFDREFYIRSYNPASSPDYDFLVGGSVAGASDHPVRTPFLSVLENAPRFWLSPEVVYVDVRDRQALAALRGTGFPAPVPVFVHSPVNGAVDKPRSPVMPGRYGTVQVMQFQPESILLRVQAPSDAWLFCAERYAPGWRASVDGQPAVLCKADFCFRAVQIPAGTHDVRLRYDPGLYKPLWILSWSMILFAFSLVAIMGVRRLLRL
jgi:hypothetical protein